MKCQLMRLAVYLSGYGVLSLGQRLFVFAGFGAASLDAVCVGLADMSGLSAGMWVNITAVLMILLSGVLRRQKPNFWAMVSSCTFGLFFDLWGIAFSQISVAPSVGLRILLYLVAIVLAPLGTAIYFISAYSKSAIDDLVMSISEGFSLPIGIAKTICEALFCIFALLFSGPLGVTTVATALLFGPILEFFYRRLTLPKQYNKQTKSFHIKRSVSYDV